MSTVKMRKLVLLGLTADRAHLIKKLQRTQLVEIKCAEETEASKKPALSAEKDACLSVMARVSSALGTYREIERLHQKINKPEPPTFKEKVTNATRPIERVSYEDFQKIVEKEKEILSSVSFVEDKALALNLLKSERTAVGAEKDALKPYLALTVPFSAVKNTKHTISLVGTVPRNAENIAARLSDFAYAESIGATDKLLFVSMLAEAEKEVYEVLTAAEFSVCPFSFDETAAERIAKCDAKLAEIAESEKTVAAEVAAIKGELDGLKQLYDYYDLELKKLEAAELCECTSACFVMEGWVPFDAEEKITEMLQKAGSVISFEFMEPKENEIVPTLNRNSFLVEKYQAVTNMYSVPNQKEIDPNPFVALFFFVYFGLMMSDAGYGILLALGATLILLIKKPKRGEMNLVFIIAMGGVSTFAWGILLGGWFGITLPEDSFLKSISWFNPIEEPLKMMILSIVLGIVQIVTGMALNAANLIKRGKWFEAITDVGSWYAIFIGIGLLALNLLGDEPNSAFNIAAYCMFGLGFIGLELAGAKGKKGIGRWFGGLGKLYGITGYLSDVLSYTRLFGLGLSTGVVAMVFNTLANLLIELLPYVGYVLAAALLIFAHTFNIAINALGAYVHNCRLQFIEFFSRFYTGEGHQFVPLGAKTKYTKLEY